MTPVHYVDGTLVAVAGVCFIIGYIIGLFAGARFGMQTCCTSVVVGLLCCVVRGYSAPLGVAAIASVSVLHVVIGCLTVLILKHTKPFKGNS